MARASASRAALAEPAVDFLSRLGTVSTNQPTRKGGAEKDAPTLTISALTLYAALHYIFNQIDSDMKGEAGNPIRETMMDHFVTTGIARGATPKNPKGVDGQSKVDASLQLRRKSSQTALTEEQCATLDGLKIPYETVTLAPHTLRIRPDVFESDKATLNKMIDCLVKNGFDESMFETQLPNVKCCVTDDTISALFRTANAAAALPKGQNPLLPARVREILEFLASPSIRPTFHGTLDEALDTVRERLLPGSTVPAVVKPVRGKK